MKEHNEKSMVDLFVGIEKSLDIQSMKLNGVYVWPYIRVSLNNKINSYFFHLKGKTPRPEPTRWHKFKTFVKSVNSAITLTFKAIKQFQWKKYFSKKKLDFLFFCYNSGHLQAGPRQINRNIIGVVEHIENHTDKRHQIWEYSSLDEFAHKQNFPGLNIAPVTAAINEWCRVAINWSSMFKQQELGFVDEINQYLSLHDVPVQLESHKLRHEIRRIDLFARFMGFFLRRANVDKVIQICYYGYAGMGLNLACYRNNVQSIEYQHDVPTQYHTIYTNWNNVPDQGYELVPQLFWAWGQATRDNVARWTQSQSHHDVKIVGNSWLAYFCDKLAGQSRAVEQKQANYDNKKLLLVTLQAYPDFYKSHVTEAIELSDDDWLWVIKEHPNFKLSDAQIEAEFGEQIRMGKVVFERELAIYEMLSFLPIKVHLTAFSTTAFECEYFNIPTVFFHENGADGHPTLISSIEHFYAALDARSVLHSVKQAIALEYIEPVYMANEITAVDDLLLAS